MALRTAVVTGSNRGLGLEMCRQLTALPESSPSYCDKIWAVCRNSSDELQQLSQTTNRRVEIVEMDVTDEQSYPKLQSLLKTFDTNPQPVSLLVHNAGAYGTVGDFPPEVNQMQTQSLDNINAESMIFAYRLNSVAPLLLTKALLPNLVVVSSPPNPPNKVIIISSAMGSISGNTSGGHYGYRSAKAAVNMIGKSLAADLKSRNVAVGLIHPGFVYTGFVGIGADRIPGQRDVDESTRGVLEAVDQVTLATTGMFWHGNYGEGVQPISW